MEVYSDGIVDDYEHIFDIYTKRYDQKCNVNIKSVQDLLDCYKGTTKNKGSEKTNIDIYTLVQYFVQNHRKRHFVPYEAPFLKTSMCKLYYYDQY